MNIELVINLAYIVAAALFIFGLKMLSSPATARRGNASRYASARDEADMGGDPTMTPARQPDLVPALAAADLPVLLVAGEHDATYAQAAAAAAKRLPRASVAIVPGAGHAPHLEAPDALADTLRAFLA